MLCAVLGNKYRLKTHIESIHEGKKYVCDICGHRAAYPQSLREHIKIVHEGKKIVKKKYYRPPKICSVCQKSVRDSYKLKMHMQSVHGNQNIKTEKREIVTLKVDPSKFFVWVEVWLWILICLWLQKTKPRILQFMNLKCCKMSFKAFKMKKQGLKY